MIRGLASPNDYRIGRSERSVGQVLVELGRIDEAIPHFDEALRIQISRQGERSDSVLRTMLLRASACIAERVELERTAQDVGRVAEVRELQALEYQTESSWEQALSAWRILEEVHELREDLNGLDEAGEAFRRINLALSEIRQSDMTAEP
jgi:tetratricopeptide (TPR) repeat protein